MAEQIIITWQANDGNLWDDTDGVDVPASETRYYDLVLDAIHAAYPNAQIVLQRQNAVGSSRGFTAQAGNDDIELAIEDHCDRLAATIFEDGDWYVTA